MKQQKITDQTFYEATAMLMRKIVEEEEANMIPHESSPGFQQKMKALLQGNSTAKEQKPKGGRTKMKKTILILVAVACLFAIGAFAGNNKPAVTPTGYPDGEIQVPCFRYDGGIYWHVDVTTKPLPEEYKNVGSINKIDNINLPSEDFAAARLEIGMEVYAVPGENNEVLYVKMEPNANIYWIFKLNVQNQ